MTITEQFKAKRCVFSIECFPPKQTTQMDKLKDTLRQMQAMDPGFISVTFGAGGSAGGVSTAEVADYIQNELHVPTLAHLICMGNDETRAAEILDQLESVGVRDVLALRGDRSPSRPESPGLQTRQRPDVLYQMEEAGIFRSRCLLPGGPPRGRQPAA